MYVGQTDECVGGGRGGAGTAAAAGVPRLAMTEWHGAEAGIGHASGPWSARGSDARITAREQRAAGLPRASGLSRRV